MIPFRAPFNMVVAGNYVMTADKSCRFYFDVIIVKVERRKDAQLLPVDIRFLYTCNDVFLREKSNDEHRYGKIDTFQVLVKAAKALSCEVLSTQSKRPYRPATEQNHSLLWLQQSSVI
jgi:hypothetical protein